MIPKPAIKPGSAWGILGGLFDPFHIGHLNLARGGRESLGLRGVLLVPSYAPPHRHDAPVTSFEQRIEMLHGVASEGDGLLVCDLEKKFEPPSYTYRVVSELVSQYPSVDFYLIIGSDNLKGFTNWFQWLAILNLVKLAVGVRPGYEIELPEGIPRDRFKPIEIDRIDLSSTELRRRLKEERDLAQLRKLLPEPVAKYILENELYR